MTKTPDTSATAAERHAGATGGAQSHAGVTLGGNPWSLYPQKGGDPLRPGSAGAGDHHGHDGGDPLRPGSAGAGDHHER